MAPNGSHAPALAGTGGAVAREAAAAPRWASHPTLANSTLFLALLWGLAIACGRLVVAARAEPGHGAFALVALGVVVAGSLALAVAARRALFLAITSLPFAVVILTALLLCTVAGTLVLQGAEPQQYVASYGSRGAKLVLALGFDDIFHSAWFNELLGLLALSLVLVPIRNRAWQPARLGHLAAHVGVVVLLAGGLVGNLGGMKGRLDLRQGQSADRLVRTDRLGAGAERVVPLGFSVRLDAFDVDRYEDAHRLRAYEPVDEASRTSGSWRATGSWGPDEVRDWTRLASGGRFRVTATYPDLVLTERLVPAPAGQGSAALSLSVLAPGGPVHVDLLAGVAGRDVVDLPGIAGRLRFAWDEPASVPAGAGARSERHFVSLAGVPAGDDAAAPAEVEVQPGGAYGLAGGWQLLVGDYLPDFSYDIATRTARSNSDRPVNPALQVTLRRPGEAGADAQWLFAKHPDLHMGHGGPADAPQLVYRHEEAQAVPVSEYVAVGRTRELLRFDQGRLADRAPLAAGLASLPVDEPLVSESVRSVQEPGTRSDDWNNPAVTIEYEDAATGRRSALLVADHAQPFRLPSGGVLSFERRGDDVKAFRSRVSILEDGRVASTATIRVNEPLDWKGFKFYQANWREDDPGYSGLQVVRDPGLPLVFTGFVLMSLGVLYVYMVRPRLLHRKVA